MKDEKENLGSIMLVERYAKRIAKALDVSKKNYAKLLHIRSLEVHENSVISPHSKSIIKRNYGCPSGCAAIFGVKNTNTDR